MAAVFGMFILVWLLGLFSGKINTYTPANIFEQAYIYLGYVLAVLAVVALIVA